MKLTTEDRMKNRRQQKHNNKKKKSYMKNLKWVMDNAMETLKQFR